MSEVVSFYDAYVEQQMNQGIHSRHICIIKHLEEMGLQRDDEVLEIGSGIGTVSELILRYLDSKGSLKVTDISPASIDIAKDRLSKYDNVTCEVVDFTQSPIEGKYDCIILPDVIEHIPINMHHGLFKKISNALKESGFVFIHIPEPNYLEWLKKNQPEKMQVIDQPIHTHILSKNLEGTGLVIDQLRSYSIFIKNPDYQLIRLKKIPESSGYDLKKESTPQFSLVERIQNKIRYYIRGGK